MIDMASKIYTISLPEEAQPIAEALARHKGLSARVAHLLIEDSRRTPVSA